MEGREICETGLEMGRRKAEDRLAQIWGRKGGMWKVWGFGKRREDKSLLLRPSSCLIDRQAHSRVFSLFFSAANKLFRLPKWSGRQQSQSPPIVCLHNLNMYSYTYETLEAKLIFSGSDRQLV